MTSGGVATKCHLRVMRRAVQEIRKALAPHQAKEQPGSSRKRFQPVWGVRAATRRSHRAP